MKLFVPGAHQENSWWSQGVEREHETRNHGEKVGAYFPQEKVLMSSWFTLVKFATWVGRVSRKCRRSLTNWDESPLESRRRNASWEENRGVSDSSHKLRQSTDTLYKLFGSTCPMCEASEWNLTNPGIAVTTRFFIPMNSWQ